MLWGLHRYTRGLWVLDHLSFWWFGCTIDTEGSCLCQTGGDGIETGDILVTYFDVLFFGQCERCSGGFLVEFLEFLSSKGVADVLVGRGGGLRGCAGYGGG